MVQPRALPFHPTRLPEEHNLELQLKPCSRLFSLEPIVFSNYPRYLHRFYDKDSVQNIVEVTENGVSHEETAANQTDIHAVIQRLFADAKARVDHVSSQFSQNGGVMLQVSGMLYRRGRPDSSFVQSFFLAVQERGYFVLNDLLRIVPVQQTPVSTTTRPRTELGNGVPQPLTPRDNGVPFVAQQVPGNSVGLRPSADPDQINQILAETKQVLSSTMSGQQGEQGIIGGGHQTYTTVQRRTSSVHGTPVAHSPHGHPMSPFQGEFPQGHESLPQSPAANSNSGFLLNTRRRNSGNGGLPGLQRNCSVFVRDIPNNVEEKNLRDIFEQFGTVTSVTIRTGKREARFAFVDFSEPAAMEKALTAELQIGGKRLLIEEKKPLVLRNKPRFTNTRANGGDPSYGGSMDGSHSHGGGMRIGVHPYR